MKPLPLSLSEFIIFVFATVFILHAKAQTTVNDLQAAINIDALEHPYLLFSKEELPALRTQIQEDPRSRRIFEQELAYAERDLAFAIEEEFSIPMFISRFKTEYDPAREQLNEYAHKAERLAFIYQLTGDQKYADKAFAFARVVCSRDSWMMPAHQFNNIYRRVWPHNVEDEQVVFNFDLGSGTNAERMALIYDWLYPALNKTQRNQIRGALLENAVLRVRGQYEYQWWATAYRCNWSSVCHSRVGLGALALLKDDPQVIDVVGKSYDGIDSTWQNLGAQGGWAEGRSYWRMTVVEPIPFVHALNKMSNGKFNHFKHAAFRQNPVSFPLYTMYANIGDGSGGVKGRTWAINKIASETDDPTAAYYLHTFVKPQERRTSLFDIIWPMSEVEPIEPQEKSRHFTSIDWAVLQSSFSSASSFSVTCKAGANDDPHHGHKDNGQVILSYRKHSFIRDLGRPKYDDYYFGADRWSYPSAMTKGHNVIMVNDEEQDFAKYKDQAWQEGIEGRMGHFMTNENRAFVAMDLSKAYPGKELRSWQRSVLLEKPNVLVILDKVQSVKGAEIRSRLHPDGKVQLFKDHYTITHEGESLLVIPLHRGEISLEQGKHASLPKIKDERVKSIPYVDVKTRAGFGVSREKVTTLLGYLVLPKREVLDMKTLVQSINLQSSSETEIKLDFMLNGKQHAYTFSQVDGMMVLLKG